MDRNALLMATRAEFMTAFLQSVDHAIALAVVAAFRQADITFPATEKRVVLDAHRLMHDNQAALRSHMQHAMEQLLDRSFQTTYSTFRPSFSKEFTSDTLSLIDASQFEDQLRVDDMTTRFRNAADQSLRDLNIRIALLFEQSTIKERENPFRPWLLTRCIATAVGALGARAEVTALSCELIADRLDESVAGIYSRVNRFLAGHGIAAQLQLRSNRPANAGPVLAGGRADIIQEAAPMLPQRAQSLAGEPSVAESGRDPNPTHGRAGNLSAHDAASSNAGIGTQTAEGRMEMLMAHVRRSATGARTGPDALHQQRPPGTVVAGLATGSGAAPADALPAGPEFRNTAEGIASRMATGAATSGAGNWLGRDGLGDLIRRFFSRGNLTQHADENVLSIDDGHAADDRIESRLAARVDRFVSMPLAGSIDQLVDAARAGTVAGAGWSMRNLIFEKRAVLMAAAGDVSEQMTIDIVAMLFEFIRCDDQIPAEVRAQLGRLQFLVLKIALRESTLLTGRAHPVRMLVDRIGSISIGSRQLDPGDTRIDREIDRVVEILLAGDGGDSTPFLTMLDAFDVFIANAFRGGDPGVDHAALVIEEAQNRTRRFTHLSARLGEVLLGLSIDAFLCDFLMTTWTCVIERAERDAVAASTRFRALVPDLLWSIMPRANSDGRAELLALLPAIVRTLREGLALIGWEDARQQPVLDWLVEAHRSVLRGAIDAPPTPALQALRVHVASRLGGADEARRSDVSEQPDFARQEVFLDQAIRESDGALQSCETIATAQEQTSIETATATATVTATATEAATATAIATTTLASSPTFDPRILINRIDPRHAGNAVEKGNAEDTAMRERLRIGVAVILRMGTVASAARVTWIDQVRSTLVLSITGQRAPMIISLRMFEALLGAGCLHFLEAAPLFERAINSIQESAETL